MLIFFNGDLFKSHHVAVLSIILDDSELIGSNLLEQHTKKNLVWDYLKSRLVEINGHIITAYLEDKYILMIPCENEITLSKKLLQSLYSQIKKWAKETLVKCEVLMGAGAKTNSLHDYYVSYQQAIQALNIVSSRLRYLG